MTTLRTRARVFETGESPFSVQIEMGAYEVVGDEPVAAGGGGLGPNPFDLMTAALAECAVMTVRCFARRHDLPLEHVEVVVDHARKLVAGAAEPVDVFDKVVFVRGSALDEEQRARLIDAAAHCPIQRLLEGAPLIHTRPGRPLDEVFDR